MARSVCPLRCFFLKGFTVVFEKKVFFEKKCFFRFFPKKTFLTKNDMKKRFGGIKSKKNCFPKKHFFSKTTVTPLEKKPLRARKPLLKWANRPYLFYIHLFLSPPNCSAFNLALLKIKLHQNQQIWDYFLILRNVTTFHHYYCN